MRTRSSHPTRRHAAALVAGALVALLLWPGPVGAGPAPVPPPPGTSAPAGTDPSDGCGEAVFDPDDRLTDGDEVTSAALRLLAHQVDLRVRVVRALPDLGDVVQLDADCGWDGGAIGSGHRPARQLLLFLVPGSGEAALWYGDALATRIGSRFPAVRDAAVSQVSFDARSTARLLTALDALVVADPPGDPFGCDRLVWDPDGQVDDLGPVTLAAFALQAEEADLRVRVEPPTDGDLDERLAQLESVCPGWQVDGDRPADRLLVMVQPSGRQSGLWYGADWSDALQDRFDDIQERDMNPRFQQGDLAGGLAAGLAALAGTTPGGGYAGSGIGGYDDGYQGDDPDRFTSGRSSSDGSRSSSPDLAGPILLVGLVVVVAWGASYLNWRSKYEAGETTERFGNYTSGRSGGYRSRRSSSGGSSRRSSGGGRRSSGGSRSSGGRRSGGGSTRW